MIGFFYIKNSLGLCSNRLVAKFRLSIKIPDIFICINGVGTQGVGVQGIQETLGEIDRVDAYAFITERYIQEFYRGKVTDIYHDENTYPVVMKLDFVYNRATHFTRADVASSILYDPTTLNKIQAPVDTDVGPFKIVLHFATNIDSDKIIMVVFEYYNAITILQNTEKQHSFNIEETNFFLGESFES